MCADRQLQLTVPEGFHLEGENLSSGTVDCIYATSVATACTYQDYDLYSS